MTRRESLQKLSYLLLVPVSGLVYTLVKSKQEAGHNVSFIRVPYSFPEGLTFFPEIIAFKKDNKVLFLSSACTHLGCKIKKEEQGILVCPCHGSSYDAEGKNLRGPANKPLQKLTYKRENITGDYLVNVESF
ncbi:MAG: Rieske 2Fe-2S domain-containing protein [Bacteroidota bacterium]